MKTFRSIFFLTALAITAAITAAFAGPLDDIAMQRKAAGSYPVNVLRLSTDAADAELVVVDGLTFEIDTDGIATSTAAGGIRVTPTALALTPTAVGQALGTAAASVNLTTWPYRASTISANEVLYEAKTLTLSPGTVSETLGGTNNAWAAATFFGRDPGAGPAKCVTVHVRSCTAVEAALQTMHFVLGYSPATAVVQVRDVNGTLKAYDGKVTISGNRVTLTASGSTDPASTDIVTIIAAD